MRQADQLQFLVDQLLPFAGRAALHFQAETDVLGDGQPGHQGELLEHHGDALGAHGLEGRRRAVGDIHLLAFMLDQQLAAADPVEAVDAAQQAGFAGAGEAHHHADLAAVHIQVGILDPEYLAGALEDFLAAHALVEQLDGFLGVGAEDHIDVFETNR
ncbi:hypothetical protein D9M71_638870 [compost metagenome]